MRGEDVNVIDPVFVQHVCSKKKEEKRKRNSNIQRRYGQEVWRRSTYLCGICVKKRNGKKENAKEEQ